MIILVMGVSGAGKTTIGRALAQEMGAVFRDGDAYHSPENLHAMTNGLALDDVMRQPWLQAMQVDIQLHAQQRRDMVLACSALKRRYRDYLMAGSAGGKIIYLHGTSAQLQQRLRQRPDHFFPAELLQSQLDALELPQSDENIIEISISNEIADIVSMAMKRLKESARYAGG